MRTAGRARGRRRRRVALVVGVAEPIEDGVLVEQRRPTGASRTSAPRTSSTALASSRRGIGRRARRRPARLSLRLPGQTEVAERVDEHDGRVEARVHGGVREVEVDESAGSTTGPTAAIAPGPGARPPARRCPARGTCATARRGISARFSMDAPRRGRRGPPPGRRSPLSGPISTSPRPASRWAASGSHAGIHDRHVHADRHVRQRREMSDPAPSRIE